MGSPAHLRLFGGFALRDAQGKPVSLTLRKTEGLIAYLAVGASRRQSRQRLAGLLWSESSQARGLQSLRQARLSLNRDLKPHQLSIVEFERREIRLDVTSLTIDAVEFARLREAGDADSLAKAVDYFRGDFLAGIEIESEAFEEWLQPTRAWYREQVEAALERLLVLQEQAGAYEACIRTAKRILAIDPLREDMHRWLMRAFVASGHRTSALAAYDACRTILREELAVTPEAETEKLYRSILHSVPPAGHEPVFRKTSSETSGFFANSLINLNEDAAAKHVLVPLSNLSSTALEVLRIAAICHNHFSRGLLEAISERPQLDHEAGLREVRRHGLLKWDAASRRGYLDDELRERVIDQLLPSHRRHLHYSAALAMSRLSNSEADSAAYEIAEHYRKAGKWAPAAVQQLKLARLEFDQGNIQSAEPLLRKVLSDLERIPLGDPQKHSLTVQTALLQVSIAEAAGETGRAEDVLKKAWPSLKDLEPSNIWVAALLAKARLCARNGHANSAYAAIRLIPEKCDGVPTDRLWLPAERFADATGIMAAGSSLLASQDRWSGHLGQGFRETDRWLVQALRDAKQHRYAAAYSACEQAVKLAEELPEPTALIVALQTLGLIQVWDGDPESALQALDRAAGLAAEWGDLLRQYTTGGYRGFALLNAGRWAEGREALARALDLARELDLRFMSAMFSAWYAEALVDAGDLEKALEVARNAAGCANERNEPWARSVALRVLGQALARRPAGDGGKLVDKILRSAQDMQNSLGLAFESARTADARAEASSTTH